MKKLIVLLGMLAVSAAIVRADGIVDVSAVGVFTGENLNTLAPSTLSFAMNFQFDITTMQGVPGTMAFTETDNLGLGPFTAPAVGQSFTNFYNAAGDLIQVGINEFGCCIGPQWPDVGHYGTNDMVLLCAGSQQCRDAFQGAGFIQAGTGAVLITPFNSGGTVTTPEPSSLLLLSLALAAVALYAHKK
jgi:PEP-CTERM motif